MTDKKPAKRAVSTPRLLQALTATMKTHDLGVDAPIGSLIAALEKDIVKASMSDLA